MSKQFIKKNIKLSLEFNNYVVNHPDIFVKIPKGAYIVITIKGDKSFNRESFSLAEKAKKREEKIIEARKEGRRWILQPLFA